MRLYVTLIVLILLGCQPGSARSNLFDGASEPAVAEYFDAAEVSNSDISVQTAEGSDSFYSSEVEGFVESDLVGVDVRGESGLFTAEVRQIVAAHGVTCAALASGEVYCWGIDGELNDGAPDEVLIRPRRINGFRDIVFMGLSAGSACGADREGRVWCLGVNAYDGLATGSTERTLRVPLRRTDVEDAEHLAWMGSTLVIQRRDGTVFARSHLVPAAERLNFMLPSVAIAIDAYAFSYCALSRDGNVSCWGAYISDRQPWSFSEGPRMVPGLEGVTEVAVGFNFYCALKRDGTVWCWGVNSVGQTGTAPERSDRCFLGRTNDDSAAVFVSCVLGPRRVEGLTEVVEIRARSAMACARKEDGTVWCWGDNGPPVWGEGTHGLIGDGQPNNEQCPQAPWSPPERTPPSVPCRRRPTRVVGLTGVSHLSLGSGYACAARTDGQIWCWGRNPTGALGDGTRMTRLTPVPVVAPF